MADVATRIAELDADLARLRPEYEAAKGKIADPSIREQQSVAWADLRAVLGTFAAGDSGDKALYVLGRAQQIVMQATPATALALVAEYERLREQRRKLEAVLPPKPEEAS